MEQGRGGRARFSGAGPQRMVRPLVDTDILIDYLNGIALAREELARYREPGISIIS